MSSPNSYHSVTDFYAKKNKYRYFIYGSFSLNKKVKWKIELKKKYLYFWPWICGFTTGY